MLLKVIVKSTIPLADDHDVIKVDGITKLLVIVIPIVIVITKSN